MSKRQQKPPDVRQMWSVFEELFAARAKRFRVDRPSPATCRAIIRDTICVLKGYEESIAELIAQRRASTRHDALPTGYPLRLTREDPTL